MSDLSINDRIAKMIADHPVILFMKGDKDEAMCGFSAQVLAILNRHGIEFHTEDVLKDWDLREGIKAYSNWPTIPQLYVRGDFIGGCDIVMDMDRKGELSKILNLK